MQAFVPLDPDADLGEATHAIEEISFDTDARSEYLTGFHKRKLQRIKNAQEQAAKREREEKVQFRKQVRSHQLPRLRARACVPRREAPDQG